MLYKALLKLLMQIQLYGLIRGFFVFKSFKSNVISTSYIDELLRRISNSTVSIDVCYNAITIMY